MDYQQRFIAWRAEKSLDPALQQELADIAGHGREIEERFYRELTFGTAGLRGVIGAGMNRMNIPVVRRATQGLADYLSTVTDAAHRGVCIAYDSRRFSREFAEETACTLAANGIRAYLFSSLHSVPQLSFTLRSLDCIAGVVITASHNPKIYNGYKVYWENGAQCAPEQAAAIYACIGKVPYFAAKTCALADAVRFGMVKMIGPAEDESYYAATAGLLLEPALLKTHGPRLKLVYTPLHGSGYVPVTALLSRVGVTNVTVVPEQAQPDENFSTVSAPNPENPDAFRLSVKLAEKIGASVCLATDPDADRLGIAVKTNAGEWVTLTGNQIGCLLLEHILSRRSEQGTLPKNGVVVKSIVSTSLADAICAAYGVEMENVMTGFRFIGEKIAAYAESGEKTFLFGFEESYGFLAGGLARDKDAVCAAILAAETCVSAMLDGKTLYDKLLELYKKYGFYEEKVDSYTLEGKAGMEKIAACMDALEAQPPRAVGGARVTVSENYRVRIRTNADGSHTPLTLPQSDMLRLLLDDGAWIVVRPSGTEPKLKLYIGASAPEKSALDARLSVLYAEMNALLKKLLA